MTSEPVSFPKSGNIKIGYARVSTLDQNPQLQHDALEKAGCEKIYVDTLVVWRLDRLGRSLRDLISWAEYLEAEGVALQSLQEAIDTSTPSGKLTFHLFGALAEFERNLIRERTSAGLAAARARGRLGGRPKRLAKDKRKLAVRLYNEKELPVGKICEMMSISKPTLYAYVREHQADK